MSPDSTAANSAGQMPPDERDDDDEQLEREHLGGDRLRRADAVQQPGEQRAADQRDDEAQDTRRTLSAPPVIRGSANPRAAAA